MQNHCIRYFAFCISVFCISISNFLWLGCSIINGGLRGGAGLPNMAMLSFLTVFNPNKAIFAYCRYIWAWISTPINLKVSFKKICPNFCEILHFLTRQHLKMDKRELFWGDVCYNFGNLDYNLFDNCVEHYWRWWKTP